MEKKTIKKILKKKIEDWISSVDDNKVKEAINDGAIVTGGSIASMLLNEEVNDFDIYFKNKNLLRIVTKYYCSKFESDLRILDLKDEEMDDIEPDSGIGIAIKNMEKNQIKIWAQSGKGSFSKEYEDEENYRPLFFSPNAITLENKIQIVIRFHGEIDEIHKNYDFVHATNSYDVEKNNLILRLDALESLLTKELYYIGSKYPVTSVIRTKKFIKRGWKISAGQYLKMLFQVSSLDLSNTEVLEEQLVGVDIAYFAELIEALRHADKDKINYTYIGKIIDRIFE